MFKDIINKGRQLGIIPKKVIAPFVEEKKPSFATRLISSLIPENKISFSGTGSNIETVDIPMDFNKPASNPKPQVNAVNNSGSDMNKIRQFYKNQMPPSSTQTVEQYYPAAKLFPNMMQEEEARNRQGLATLLALQAFFETTGGRNAGFNNLFGTKPQGMVNSFGSLEDSLNYQLSENVLSGGATPNMNIFDGTGALTPQRIETLYDSYNPPGAYRENILNYYKQLMGY